MGTTYDGLYDAAVELMHHAAEEHLSTKYQIRKRGDLFYGPRDRDMWGYSDDRYSTHEIEKKVEEAYALFEDVPSLFDKFTGMPDPGGFDASIDSMRECMRHLCVGKDGVSDPVSGELVPYNTELKNLSTSAGYLDEWDGVAMMQFRDEFIAKFEDRVLNQFNAAAVIKNAWEAEKELWKRARANICQIVDDAHAGLDEMHSCGKNEWTVGLSVVGAVVAIGSAVATAGGTAAIALAAVGAAGSVASSVAGTMDEPPDVRFSGESAVAVIQAVRDGLATFEEELRAAEDKIKNACDTAKGTLTASQEDYVAPKPALLDGGSVGHPDAD